MHARAWLSFLAWLSGSSLLYRLELAAHAPFVPSIHFSLPSASLPSTHSILPPLDAPPAGVMRPRSVPLAMAMAMASGSSGRVWLGLGLQRGRQRQRRLDLRISCSRAQLALSQTPRRAAHHTCSSSQLAPAVRRSAADRFQLTSHSPRDHSLAPSSWPAAAVDAAREAVHGRRPPISRQKQPRTTARPRRVSSSSSRRSRRRRQEVKNSCSSCNSSSSRARRQRQQQQSP